MKPDTKTKSRIVFAHCTSDPWILPITQDIYRAIGEDEECELFVLGRGENRLIPPEGYINLENPCLHLLCTPSGGQERNYQKFIEQQYIYQKRNSIRNSMNEQNIKKHILSKRKEADFILRLLEPDLLIVWNGSFTDRSCYVEAAQANNIPLYYAEKGMLPESWYLDPLGINAASSIAQEKNYLKRIGNIDKAVAAIKEKLEGISRRGQSAWNQPPSKELSQIRHSLGVGRRQKIVFFPAQVDHDSNIILFSDYFHHCSEVVRRLRQELSPEKYFILVKPHPKGKTGAQEYQKILSGRGSAICDLNIYDAISLTDCVVSINSTVAFEAAVRNKPVFLLGKGILNNKDFVSAYHPAKGSIGSQIEHCLKGHEDHKHDFENQSLAFAAFLDKEYYLYRGNYQKTRQCIRRIIFNLDDGKPPKAFSREDVFSFFSPVDYSMMADYFSGKTVLRALLGKLKRRLERNFGRRCGLW